VTGDALGPQETAFISQRDSFYMASVSETGWPYMQHRGGPKGFLHVLSPSLLGFADLRGNRQYVSVGNLQHDDRVALFLMDYPHQTRLKILGHAEIHEGDAKAAELLPQLNPNERNSIPERIILIRVEGFDWNCPQHITPRFTAEDLQEALAPVQQKIAALEAENEELRSKLAELTATVSD
jgi:predicted pyridoxine 5'-phosphate oxidase superfamily flavin-nucleotide-binding protein